MLWHHYPWLTKGWRPHKYQTLSHDLCIFIVVVCCISHFCYVHCFVYTSSSLFSCFTLFYNSVVISGPFISNFALLVLLVVLSLWWTIAVNASVIWSLVEMSYHVLLISILCMFATKNKMSLCKKKEYTVESFLFVVFQFSCFFLGHSKLQI